MDARSRFRLYDEAQLGAVLDVMAGRLAGLLAGKTGIVLVGILRRGAPLASLLEARLADRGIRAEQRLDLQIKRYGDDLTLLFPETRLTENPAHADLNLAGKTVVVVDDVLYRGHSLLRAVQYLAARDPAEIRTVVLVDRDVTLLPIHADITGVRLDVAPGHVIECHVPPYEPDFCIELLAQPPGFPA
jgi:pyrimidine operon attenuation protein/uracil phosphoribosyltransferase